MNMKWGFIKSLAGWQIFHASCAWQAWLWNRIWEYLVVYVMIILYGICITFCGLILCCLWGSGWSMRWQYLLTVTEWSMLFSWSVLLPGNRAYSNLYLPWKGNVCQTSLWMWFKRIGNVFFTESRVKSVFPAFLHL